MLRSSVIPPGIPLYSWLTNLAQRSPDVLFSVPSHSLLVWCGVWRCSICILVCEMEAAAAIWRGSWLPQELACAAIWRGSITQEMARAGVAWRAGGIVAAAASAYGI